MRVIAKKTVAYDGVYYKAGQEFDIESKHFKVLSFIGKVAKAPAKPTPKPKAKAAPTRRATTQTRAVKAEEEKLTENEASTEDDVDVTPARGEYSRRDMKAES
jgi:hypothetical protein